jgi:S1-C subfamily serine protease
MEGDIIISFKGITVNGIDDLHKLLGEQEVGVRSELVVLRRTEIKNLQIIPSRNSAGQLKQRIRKILIKIKGVASSR